MSNMIKKIGKHATYFLWSNVIYGLIVYFTFTWLAKYSPLYAYLGNLTLIVLGLVIDGYTQSALQSKKLVAELREDKNKEKNIRFVNWITDGFISFKTSLYMFYVFILVLSQIIKLYPAFLNENIISFIAANDYSILLLIALDTLIKQFLNDRKKMKIISEKLKKELTEEQQN